MNLRGPDHEAVRDFLKNLEASPESAPQGEERGFTSGNFFGPGGPTYSDGYNSQPAPNDDRLIQAFRGVTYACARLNAHGVAQTPLRLYATTVKGEARPRCDTRPTNRRTIRRLERMSYSAPALTRGSLTALDEVTEHPLLTLVRTVNKSPDNPFAGLQSLLFYLQLCKEIVANAYWKTDRDGLNVPSQLWPMDPRVKPIPFGRVQPDGRIIDHYLDAFGEQYSPSVIARFRFLSPKNPYVGSMGPMEACYQEAGIRDKFEASVEALLGNAFHPSAIISAKNPDRPMGNDVKPRLEADVKKKFTRAGTGGIVFTDGSIEYNPWVNPPTDTGGLEVSKDAKITITNCFDVPMTLLEMQASNRAAAEAATYAHALKAIAPRCEGLAEEFTAWTHRLDRDGGLNWTRLIWAFDNPVPEDEQRDMLINVGYVEAQIMVPDEVREELGLPPRPDGKGSEVVEAKQPETTDGKDGKKKPKPNDSEDD